MGQYECCKWCSAIAGRYEYSEAPEDIYRRHDNCGCTVTYENGRTRQDVWSKKTWEVPEVKQKNSTPKKLSYEQGKAIEQQNLPRIGVDKSGGSGIINTRGDNAVNLVIDKFTPCLENAQTGKIIPTVFSKVSQEELKELKGWKFNWLDETLTDCEIYKLCLSDNDTIQGLVALTDFKRDKAVYVNIAESAPHNLGKHKKFNGVGGHLFAIACQTSVNKGYGGFVFMDAKNSELVEHYKDALGAALLGRPHPYRMIIDEEKAMKLLKIYTFEEG